METKITGLTKLFEQSIGIVEPWYIRSIETQGAEVHIYVDIREGNLLPCPECGKMCIRAGYENNERVWRHGDCLFYPCYVYCRRPSDLSASYRSGIQYCFPQAKHTVDKFHVKKLLLDAMDEVRRGEQQSLKSKNKINRKLFMIPERKQSKAQREKVEKLSKEYLKTGRAFRMVQGIDTVYASDNIEMAEERLNRLYRRLRKSRPEPMKKTATILRNYSVEILNIFRSRVTNAIC